MKAAGHEFPEDLHYLVEHQVWLRLDDDSSGTVGITALGAALAGEFYMCRPKAPGSVVVQGGGIAVAELAKSVVSVKSPAGGTVIEVNPLLAAEPGRVLADPYGSGWLARLRLDAWPADAAALLHGAGAVGPAMEHHAWLMQAAPPEAG
jgi:glycine cleavage system H protein